MQKIITAIKNVRFLTIQHKSLINQKLKFTFGKHNKSSAKNRSKAFTLMEIMIALGVLAVILLLAVPSYNNLILDRKINSAAKDIETLLMLAKNTAVTSGRSVAVCASNGNNNCIHNEDFAVKGANLLSVHFEPPKTYFENEQVNTGNKVVKKSIKNNPNAAVPRFNTSDPFVQQLTNEAYKWDRPINLIKKYTLIIGYILGYVDLDKSKGGDIFNQLVPNGKGYLRIEEADGREKPIDYPSKSRSWGDNFFIHWQPAAGKIGGNNSGIRRFVVGCGIPKYIRDKDIKNSKCKCDKNSCSAMSINIDHLLEDEIITKKVEKKTDGKLVFNPKRDANGKLIKDGDNYVASEDVAGIIHRLHELKKSKININSIEQTLIFSPDSITSRIYSADINQIKPVINGAAIQIADTKRGVGKHSRQVCMNVLGLITIIDGTQECKF